MMPMVVSPTSAADMRPYDPAMKRTREYIRGRGLGLRGHPAPAECSFAEWWGWRDGAAQNGYIEACGPFWRAAFSPPMSSMMAAERGKVGVA